MNRIALAATGLFVLIVPASASLTPSKNCVTYSSSFDDNPFNLIKENPVECLVVKKPRVRHVFHHHWRRPHVKQISHRSAMPVYGSGDVKEDIWRAVHGVTVNDLVADLWRQYNEWLKRQPVQ